MSTAQRSRISKQPPLHGDCDCIGLINESNLYDQKIETKDNSRIRLSEQLDQAGICVGRNIGNQLSTGIVAAVLSCGMISYCFSEPNKVESELRERCGKRTEEIWKEKFGIDDNSNTKDRQIITKYENHYNATLDKCFYLTRSDIVGKKKVTKVERLFDVDENKEYGRFTGGNGDTFHICVLFLGKGTHKCSSEDEWRVLIKQYMEDAN